MKHILLSFLITIISLNTQAQDMSRTEKYDDVYVSQADGTELYRGGCSLHQDFENEMFVVTKIVVEYFEPRYFSELGFADRMKGVEKELITQAASWAGVDSLTGADDITVEKIKSTKLQGLDLWRLNIGVGGGNGMYLVFNRILKNKKPVYERMSNVFDGDIAFCDSMVWTKK